MTNKSYRYELDGLRALAVLSVIIYHAELNCIGFRILPGGFLGVDIFFVLSGFLITGILIDRSTTLFTFYKSRIDRIYPALLLMLAFSCFLTLIFLIPHDILNFIEQLKGAIAFFSNYIFMNEDSYIADSSRYKILLHTWSLGIEWQYYLVFPFIVYIIKKLFNNNFEQILIILFACSFFYCLYLMKINPTIAFYSTISRVWELFAGGIVYLASKYIKENKINNFLSAFGLVIILYCIIFFRDTDSHPGFVSLWVIIGTAFFILFIQEDSLVYKIFTLKSAIFIGVISYSLYLYHQPILVFYRFSQGEINNKVFIILLILIIVVSAFSYKFFENPIRRSKNNKKYFILLFLIFTIVLFYKGAQYTEGYKFRKSKIAAETLRHFEIPEFRRLKIYGKPCAMREPSEACEIDNGGKNLVIAGDSFVGVFDYIFSEQKNISTMYLDYEQCPLLLEGIWFGNVPQCSDINKKRWIKIQKLKPSNFLIGANFTQFYGGKKPIDNYIPNVTTEAKEKLTGDEVYQNFRAAIEKLISLGHNPIILLQPPLPFKDNKIFDVAKELKRQVSSGKLTFEYEFDAIPTTNIDNDIRRALKGLNVTYIDMNGKMCNESSKCLTFNQNGALFNGENHLSYFGAKLFMEDIINAMK